MAKRRFASRSPDWEMEREDLLVPRLELGNQQQPASGETSRSGFGVITGCADALSTEADFNMVAWWLRATANSLLDTTTAILYWGIKF